MPRGRTSCDAILRPTPQRQRNAKHGTEQGRVLASMFVVCEMFHEPMSTLKELAFVNTAASTRRTRGTARRGIGKCCEADEPCGATLGPTSTTTAQRETWTEKGHVLCSVLPFCEVSHEPMSALKERACENTAASTRRRRRTTRRRINKKRCRKAGQAV
jgi:hypothetical protein